jgi:hypothetical protein
LCGSNVRLGKLLLLKITKDSLSTHSTPAC